MKNLFGSNTFWGITGLIVAILLFFIGYYLGDKKREPVYAIKKEPSLIFDKNNSAPNIKLYANDSTLIVDNVYVTSIVIWNNGELEIKKSDLRKDFKIYITDDAKILDYKITHETHPNLSNFRIKKIKEFLILDWDYFDPNFGVELQITYTGNEKSHAIADAYVLNAELKQVFPKTPSSKKEMLTVILATLFLNITFLLVLSFQRGLEIKDKIIARLDENYKKPMKSNILWSPRVIILIYVSAATIILCVYLYKEVIDKTELPF
ncbi:hypothetical protein PP178_12840 [Zeaxanthinibacter sp. PT1]|uniref:hypothetical protein n=1 Tax=Zeaxanthinibacter TaxID=561554 RepID=UPI002349F356|nr:hypothetical protein [Zeaxanthinibacter sp. PT1]MDC6352440.1 hypothetical protein [Zeaxanthinibacter sp. PT1]